MPKIATNFQVGSAQPIDSRFVVEKESELSGLKAYEGLEVYVKELKSKKMYNGTEWVDITFTKESIGLGNVDNTSDLDKPVSNATKEYIDNILVNGGGGDIDLSSYATKSYVEAVTKRIKHDIVPVENLLYRLEEREIKLYANEVDFSTAQGQAVYSIELRSYAPKKAVYFKHSLGRHISDSTYYTFTDICGGTDAHDRNYASMNVPIADYIDDAWVYKGINSTEENFICQHYAINWYDENKRLVEISNVRINLTNIDTYNSELSSSTVEYVNQKLVNYYSKNEYTIASDSDIVTIFTDDLVTQ